MRYQIRHLDETIIDRDLSYEEALMYTESSSGDDYSMEPMKKRDDQNDCDHM